MPTMSTSVATNSIPVWDIWIRIFHWALVLTVSFSLISGETGWLFFEGHKLAGEIVVALILFRLVWSIVGSSNASLIRLLVNPKYAISHLRSLFQGTASVESGHSASGGWAVLLMLCIIGFQAVSGLYIADQDEMLEGVFYGSLSADAHALLLKLHYMNADLIEAIVFLHIVVIAIYAWRAGRNLVTPMITGNIHLHTEKLENIPTIRAGWVGALLAAAVISLIGWWVSWW